MKILKLLNNKYLPILLIIFLLGFNAKAEDEPIDIWNIDQNKTEENETNNSQNTEETTGEQKVKKSLYDLQSQKEIDMVQVSSSIESSEVKIIALYDPEDYDLKIDLT